VRRHRWAIAVVVGLVLVLLVAGYAAAGYVVATKSMAVAGLCHSEHATFTPASFRTDVWISDEFSGAAVDPAPYLMPDYREVSFPARGEASITIAGWWIPGPKADSPAVIVVHGWGSCRRDPAILLPAGMLHREGFGVLMIDMRNHGDSTHAEGMYGFGSDEYRDILGAWDWLVGQGARSSSIGVLGQSGGAAAIVVAMGEEPRLVAGWEESGASDLGSAAVEELRRQGYPEFLAPGGMLWMEVFGHDVLGKSPLAEAARIGSRPFQVVQGTNDKRVAPHHADDLEAVLRKGNPADQVWRIEGASHVQGPFLVPGEYQRRLGEFFDAALVG
jgi:uncharacterized protein